MEIELLRGGYFQFKKTTQKLQEAEEGLREHAQTLETVVEDLRTTTVSIDALAKEVAQRKQAEQWPEASNSALTS